jgi:hypothetical protein
MKPSLAAVSFKQAGMQHSFMRVVGIRAKLYSLESWGLLSTDDLLRRKNFSHEEYFCRVCILVL